MLGNSASTSFPFSCLARFLFSQSLGSFHPHKKNKEAPTKKKVDLPNFSEIDAIFLSLVKAHKPLVKAHKH